METFGVKLRLVGTEKAHNTHTIMTLGMGKHEEHIAFEESQVLEMVDIEQPLRADQEYSQPFSIYLPHNIPPSMEFQDEASGGSCSISYVLTASLDETELSTERELTIHGARISEKKHPCIREPENFPLSHSTLNLRDEGYLTMALKAEDTHIAKGGVFEFAVACRNRSRCAIHRCEIKVMEEIHWKTKFHHMKKERKLAYFPNVILEGIADQVKGLENVPKLPHLQSVDGATHSELHADLTDHKNRLRLKLSGRARHSYQGELIQIQHYLQVTMIMHDKKGHHHRRRLHHYHVHNEKPSTDQCQDPMMRIPLYIFDPPSEHSRLNSSHSMKTDLLQEVIQTSWPDDNRLEVNPLLNESSQSSCEMIPEAILENNHGGIVPLE